MINDWCSWAANIHEHQLTNQLLISIGTEFVNAIIVGIEFSAKKSIGRYELWSDVNKHKKQIIHEYSFD